MSAEIWFAWVWLEFYSFDDNGYSLHIYYLFNLLEFKMKLIKTQIINIKDAPLNWRKNKNYVYIGRPSKWGNKYKINKEKDQNRLDVIIYFMLQILGIDIKNIINELYGKTLVCYCKPKICHGDVYKFICDLVSDYKRTGE